MIMIKLLDARRGLHSKCEELFNDAKIAELIYRFLCDGIEECEDVEPERKKGKWIIKDNPGTGWYRVTCSECGEDVTSVIPVIGFFPNAKPIWNFCPECGSDNREESDNG